MCKNCGKEFKVWKYNILKGFGKYCSKACSNTGNKLGFKKGHGSYWTEESKEKFSLKMSDEKHPMWRGKRAKKVAIHMWVARKLGKPKMCEQCSSGDKKVYDWANKDHRYSRDLDDYMRLCRSCHRKYDILCNGLVIARKPFQKGNKLAKQYYDQLTLIEKR